MKIFLITDNKWWYDKATELFSSSTYDVTFFCSTSSSEMFENELIEKKISLIKVKDDYRSLVKNFDLGISAHCKQIFPSALVKNMKCINIHPGLNPYNRGWYPQVFSILNKKPAGATIHIMDDQIDHGAIIIQEEVEVQINDTSKTLYDKILKTEFKLFKNNFDDILSDGITAKAMEIEGNYNSINDFKDLCEIDLGKIMSLGEAIDYLRALTHPPFKNAYFFDIDGEKIYLEINISKEN